MSNLLTSVVIVGLMAFTSCKGSDVEHRELKSGDSNSASGDSLAIDDTDQYMVDSAASAGTDDGSAGLGMVDMNGGTDISDWMIDAIAKKVMSDLDTDSSGSLSLTEFLAGPDHFGRKFPAHPIRQLNDVQKQRMTARLTKDFQTYAGSDGLMTIDELKIMLLAEAPRICEFRRHHGFRPPFGGRDRDHDRDNDGDDWRHPGPRPGKCGGQFNSPEEVFKKYDKNGDGKLDEDEFKAMLDDRRQHNHICAGGPSATPDPNASPTSTVVPTPTNTPTPTATPTATPVPGKG